MSGGSANETLPSARISSIIFFSTSEKEMRRLSKNFMAGLLHIKVTYPEVKGGRGIIEEHNELIGGKVVAIKGEYSSVARLPDKAEIASQIKDGYTYLTLPEIVGYGMFLLK